MIHQLPGTMRITIFSYIVQFKPRNMLNPLGLSDANDDLLFIGLLGTNCSEILVIFNNFHTKISLKI